MSTQERAGGAQEQDGRDREQEGGWRILEKNVQLVDIRDLQIDQLPLDIFSDEPQPGDAFYFGFDNDLSDHILSLQMDFDPKFGIGIRPDMPPYEWHASSPDGGWPACEVERDTTAGMNVGGRIEIHLPKLGKRRLGQHNNGIEEPERYWLRVQVKQPSTEEARRGMRPYKRSPRLRRIVQVASIGGTVDAIHARRVEQEFIGQSNGLPDQRFHLGASHILPRQPTECLRVVLDGLEHEGEQWEEVRDFSRSTAQSRHYTLDSATGELRLGPAVRQPDGEIRFYGAVPPLGTNLIFERYRYGGGREGNVPAGSLNVLKTSIPYIARVVNRIPARGGRDEQTVEAAKFEVQRMLRTRQRAVTAEDYETLVLEQFGDSIARVKCLPQIEQDDAGKVRIVLIPRVPEKENSSQGQYLTNSELHLPDALKHQVERYLDRFRVLTARLEVTPARYERISVDVTVIAAPGIDRTSVEAEIVDRLNTFLHPFTGGAAGNGWPFGRDLYVADVHQCLQSVPMIEAIERVDLYETDADGTAHGSGFALFSVAPEGVVVSGRHTVAFR